MSEARATLNNYRQSPRKVRLVANILKGKNIDDALVTLSFTPKRAAKPLEKLLASALANAKNLSLGDNLIVKEIKVDGGPILYRRMPRARGVAYPIRKRTSHVTIVLSESTPKETKQKKTSKK